MSVVIPTFNGAAFVRQAIESVLAQSRPPDEIVVVDDASTDSTLQVLAELAAPVRTIRLDCNSGGPARPLNVGVASATGELIVTLDQDDVMAPDRIAWQAGFLGRHPTCSLAFGLYQLVEQNGPAAAPQVRPEEILRVQHRRVGDDEYLLDSRSSYAHLLAGRNFVHGASNIAFRKSAWQRLGGICEKFRVVWDCDFACRVCTLGGLGFIARVVQFHRVHERNLSGQDLLTETERAELRWTHVRHPLLDVDLSGSQAELRESYFGLGYFEARRGQLLASLRAYGRAARLGVDKTRALYGFASAFPHVLKHHAGWTVNVRRQES